MAGLAQRIWIEPRVLVGLISQYAGSEEGESFPLLFHCLLFQIQNGSAGRRLLLPTWNKAWDLS